MKDKKLLFIFNPKSGKAQIKMHLLNIIDTFVKAGYQVEAYPTQGAKDAIEYTAARAKDFDMIVCSGGDGTLDEVVAGLLKSGAKVPLGYVPAGSTNDFAGSLKLPKTMTKAAQVAVGGADFACDIGTFNDQTFVYIAAFGLFTDVSYLTDQNMKNVLGHMAYLLEGAKRLNSYPSYHMKFEANGTVIEDDFMYGMITNSYSVGGFKNITGQNVKMDDGVFEVTLVKTPKNVAQLNQLMTALVMRDVDTECMYCFKASQILFECEDEVPWTLDGEYGGHQRKVSIQNEMQALEIIVP